MNLRYHDRVLVVGSTGSGKSELLNLAAAHVRCQRLIVDTKDEFSVAGVEPHRGNPDSIDWERPVIHYVDGGGGPDEFDKIFSAAFRRRHLVVVAHELSDLCEYQPGRTPPNVNAYVSKGRAHGLGLLGGTQRPVNIPVRARTECEHVFLFPPRLSPQDHDTMAEVLGMRREELGEVVDATHAQLGPYSYLYWCRAERQLEAHPPLSEPERRAIRIGRRTVQ